jgi:hypothetical protein
MHERIYILFSSGRRAKGALGEADGLLITPQILRTFGTVQEMGCGFEVGPRIKCIRSIFTQKFYKFAAGERHSELDVLFLL